ncbi:MAG: alpha/beta hydrolase, partial [Alloacidobacterium sp.]
MKTHVRSLICLLLALSQIARSQTNATAPDTTVHTIQFVTVEPGVKLEVLDYGGSGPAMIFLVALGPDAHDWDKFAPEFIGKYHVYAITRRGFGASDHPAPTDENYSADRLGNDVLAVMAKLKIDKPVLVGWSVGGEELSSVGSRFPGKVKALIYLDAGYPYAFYNRAEAEPLLERAELRRLLNQAARENPPGVDLMEKLLASMTINEEELRKSIASEEKKPRKGDGTQHSDMPPMPPEIIAIMTNGMKYTKIPVPVLAIFATQRDSADEEEWRN